MRCFPAARRPCLMQRRNACLSLRRSSRARVYRSGASIAAHSSGGGAPCQVWRARLAGVEGGGVTMNGTTRPLAATEEDKFQISSTKSETNSKLQTQMTKTEHGEDKTNGQDTKESEAALGLRSLGAARKVFKKEGFCHLVVRRARRREEGRTQIYAD